VLKTLTIENLRGIRKATIEGLAPLTVFVGANGSGKSTVLEAAGVACSGGNPAAAIPALFAREWLGLEGLHYTIPEAGTVVTGVWNDDKIEVRVRLTEGFLPALADFAKAQGEGGPFRTVSVQHHMGLVNHDGRVVAATGADKGRYPYALHSAAVDRPAGAQRRFANGHFSSELRTALTAIKLSPWYPQWLEFLKLVRPNIVSVESLAIGDRDEPFVFENAAGTSRSYPVAYAGDGFRRSLRTAATLASATGGIAALDEPEAFAHPSLQGSLARLIHGATEKDVQVLVATHSLEFVRTLAREFESAPERFAIVGLRRVDVDLDAITFDGLDAYERLVSYGDDLRL